MLIGIDRRTTAELLYTLALMGHGDEIVIADANFPAASIASHCTIPEIISLSGLSSPEAADVISRLMPLDTFVDYAALRMEIDDAPEEMSDAHTETFDILRQRMPDGAVLSSIERQAFYAQAKESFAVVRTSEVRPFGCFILRKGVVF